MSGNEALLEPSLHGEGHVVPIYSATTGYLIAFFGGPIAGCGIALIDAYRLGRLRRDWPLAVAAVLLTSALFAWQARGGDALAERFLGRGAGELLYRMLGVAFFGVIFLLHRRFYRSMEILGISPYRKILPGVLAFSGGLGMVILLRALVSP